MILFGNEFSRYCLIIFCKGSKNETESSGIDLPLIDKIPVCELKLIAGVAFVAFIL
jgi:hypothetical protein